MKKMGLRSITIKKFNHAGSSKSDNKKEYPNLLEQDFFAEKPSEKWVGDITYIYTKETSWTYLAIVMDLFDLKVVGWSYGLNMTDDLVIDAFNKALINRGLKKGGIYHSDRGSQYTSNDYEKLLEELGISPSEVTYQLQNLIEAHNDRIFMELNENNNGEKYSELVIKIERLKEEKRMLLDEKIELTNKLAETTIERDELKDRDNHAKELVKTLTAALNTYNKKEDEENE